MIWSWYILEGEPLIVSSKALDCKFVIMQQEWIQFTQRVSESLAKQSIE
jgi:hypothetical protein